MYTLINGSPKPINSNSSYFLKYISSKLNEYQMFELKKEKYVDIINNLKISNTLILAFPHYVDSPTSITLKFLDYIIDNKIDLNNKSIYVIINCGFREGTQNITALNIIKSWCRKVNAMYSGSILIGAGEVVGKKNYKFISRKAINNLKKFTKNIINQRKGNEIITTMDLFNNKMYCYIANLSWRKKCHINNLTKEDVIIK